MLMDENPRMIHDDQSGTIVHQNHAVRITLAWLVNPEDRAENIKNGIYSFFFPGKESYIFQTFAKIRKYTMKYFFHSCIPVHEQLPKKQASRNSQFEALFGAIKSIFFEYLLSSTYFAMFIACFFLLILTYLV